MQNTNEESKKKILIIDDEAENITIIEGYLSSFGYGISIARNGKEGIDMLQKINPDLVLLDINLPDKDGFQVIKEIKDFNRFRYLPVVFLSGYDRANFKVKALELGADDYITRPFNKAELLARLRAVLRRSQTDKCENIEAMTGNLLDHMGLVELLQPLEIGKRDAWVKLKDIDAELIIKKGLLVYIRQGNFTGLDALDRILLGERGRFSITFSNLPDTIPAQSMKKPLQLTKAIMDSISYLDEVKSLIGTFISVEKINTATIVITPEIKKLKGSEKFIESQLVPVSDLIITLNGDLKDVADNLIKISRANNLKINLEKADI